MDEKLRARLAKFVSSPMMTPASTQASQVEAAWPCTIMLNRKDLCAPRYLRKFGLQALALLSMTRAKGK